jgi:hypothetical protein
VMTLRFPPGPSAFMTAPKAVITRLKRLATMPARSAILSCGPPLTAAKMTESGWPWRAVAALIAVWMMPVIWLIMGVTVATARALA